MDLFEGCDWTGIRIHRVVPVLAKASEQLVTDYVNPREYQLGVKFHGRTEINFADKQLLFDTGTVLYLPICKNPDTPYNKYIRENGTGVCIFFTSAHPLPSEAMTIKDASIPLELFTRVLTAWQTVGGELACLGAFYTLLGELHRVTHEHASQGGALDHRLMEARTYIDAHTADAYLDIKGLADFCGLSPEYFRQSFRKRWGVTPLRYLSGQKMARARELLSGTDYPISHIAMLCGFADPNYFIRFFHRHEGITPGNYRIRYLKRENG
jgi:AraC-like DNA-binding protein